MRYFLAILIVICGMGPFVVDGDATVLALCFLVSMALIWSKTDWTKGPYKVRR